MKTLLIIAALILLATNAQAEWSKADKSLFTAELAISAVDIWQTSQFTRYGIKEVNPIFRGRTDDLAFMISTIAMFHAVEYILLDRYPEVRAILPYQVAFHVGIVAWNRNVLRADAGIKIPF